MGSGHVVLPLPTRRAAPPDRGRRCVASPPVIVLAVVLRHRTPVELLGLRKHVESEGKSSTTSEFEAEISSKRRLSQALSMLTYGSTPLSMSTRSARPNQDGLYTRPTFRPSRFYGTAKPW